MTTDPSRLPSNVDKWELFTTIREAVQSGQSAWRTRLILFFAVYAVIELLAAAAVQEVSILGVDIRNVDALLTITPFVLTLLLYESIEALLRTAILEDTLDAIVSESFKSAKLAMNALAGAGYGNVSEALRDNLEGKGLASARAASVSTWAAYGARFLVIPLFQLLAVGRGVAIIVDRFATDWWTWPVLAGMLLVVISSIALYVSMMKWIVY